MKHGLLAAGLGALAAATPAPAAPAQAMSVILLGTGSPVPAVARFGPATLVEAGSERLLFDAGRGVSQRLWQLHLPLSSVTGVFLTHLHSDHTVGFPDFWLTGWLPLPYGGRRQPLQVWGPEGTRAMMANLERAYHADIAIRSRGGLSTRGAAIAAVDIQPGVVLERNGVRVTAFLVDHGAFARPAFGYRVDYAGHAVVISGDTRPVDTLIRSAAGADVLVHEVAMAPPGLAERSEMVRHILGVHTTPAQAGAVFARVKPRLAVYTHVLLLGGAGADSAVAPPSESDVIRETRTAYAGPLAMGEDLMRIDIGDSVVVHQPGEHR